MRELLKRFDPRRKKGPQIEYLTGERNTFTRHVRAEPWNYHMAKGLVQDLGVQKGTSLDVGTGNNPHIIPAMRDAGIDAHSIDLLHESEPAKPGVVKEVTKNGDSQYYWGDVADLDSPQSALQGKKFDLVTFWGSWMNSGSDLDNWTIKDMGQILAGTQGKSMKKMESAGKQKQIDVLQACKDALEQDGKIVIVSPRYAHHGGRYPLSHLVEEINHNHETIEHLKKLGAKKITVFAKSKEETEAIIDNVLEEIREDLTKRYGEHGNHFIDDILKGRETTLGEKGLVIYQHRLNLKGIRLLREHLKTNDMGIIDAVVGHF